MIYGLYDTQDNVWMGDKAGPRLFDSAKDEFPTLARTRAMMVDAQLGQQAGRTQAREWKPAEVRLRDEKPVLRDALAALTLLEGGSL